MWWEINKHIKFKPWHGNFATADQENILLISFIYVSSLFFIPIYIFKNLILYCKTWQLWLNLNWSNFKCMYEYDLGIAIFCILKYMIEFFLYFIYSKFSMLMVNYAMKKSHFCFWYIWLCLNGIYAKMIDKALSLFFLFLAVPSSISSTSYIPDSFSYMRKGNFIPNQTTCKVSPNHDRIGIRKLMNTDYTKYLKR